MYSVVDIKFQDLTLSSSEAQSRKQCPSFRKEVLYSSGTFCSMHDLETVNVAFLHWIGKFHIMPFDHDLSFSECLHLNIYDNIFAYDFHSYKFTSELLIILIIH